MDKLIIGFIYIWVTCLTPIAWAVPQEQDRAILEGNETNLLPNPGYEARTSGWSASGSSTLAIEFTNPIKGKFSAKWDPSATGEFLDSELIQIESGFVGDRCQMEFKYRWPSGVTGEIKAVLRQFDDSEASEDDVASIDLTPTSGDLNSIIQLPMIDCPDDPADSYRFRLESTADAAEITLDKTFLGSGRNTFQLSSSSLAAHAFYATTTDCVWAVTSVTFADFPTDTDCPSITVTSSTTTVDTTDNNLPDFVLPDLLPGRYLIKSVITGRNDTDANTFGFKLIDETDTISRACGVNQNNPNNIYKTVCETSFVLTRKTSKTFRIQGFAAVNTVEIRNATNSKNLSFTLLKFPLNDAQAITLETIGEHWDVNIGGANVDMGTSNLSVYTEIDDSGLDMVINSNSKVAEIPCSATNPSTGLTCSVGNESLGIVIDISASGRYEACASFGHFMSGDAAGNGRVIFQWIETLNNAQGILQRGKSRIPSSGDNSAAQAGAATNPVKLCGSFTFTSVGQKTLRIMREQQITATISNNAVRADRDASNGQRDIHITVENKDQQKPTPIFTDLTNSLNKRLIVGGGDTRQILSAMIRTDCTSSASIIDQPGTFIASVSNISGGLCTYTTTDEITNWFGCTAVQSDSTNPSLALAISNLTTGNPGTFQLDCDAAATGTDCTGFRANIVCHYVK